MNYRLIFSMIGKILIFTSVFLVPSAIVSVIYSESLLGFVYSALIMLGIGLPLAHIKPKESKFHAKDGFIAVSLAWLMVAVVGAFPFFFSGYYSGYVECFFESVSGFTTTGASILREVELLPKGIIFWRSFTQWIGGMGVLVFVLAVMPNVSASTYNLLKAESPGPAPSKIVPKIRETAKIMYMIYLAMTFACLILLIISGMPVYDSFIHALSTAGTGGFSCMNASIGAYNNLPAEIIITVFMFLFSVNFSLFYFMIRKDFKAVYTDEELRLFAAIIIIAIAVIAIDLALLSVYSPANALRNAAFQVSSIISSTGFTTADYNAWPAMSRVIIILLMFIGASAGSTGGGIKVIRILIMFKAVKNEIHKIIHPRIIKTTKINGKKIEVSLVSKISLFFFIYFTIMILGTILISLDGNDIVTNFTASIAALSNTGPGLEIVGPYGNYSGFSPFSKIVLSFMMLAGRLEFYPFLILFIPSIWKKGA